MTSSDLLTSLRPLLAAEAAAEAPGAGVEAADLEQSVWLRLLERTRAAGPPSDPAAWLRASVRTEARSARRRTRREVPYDPTAGEPFSMPGEGVEPDVLAAERRAALRAAVRRLPGRCPRLLRAMLSPADPTYREVADELGISQGSLGPVRSRCLECLRRMLGAEVAAPELWGKER
jgi:RNA polymerase sigma factor (sigma-70 family)